MPKDEIVLLFTVASIFLPYILTCVALFGFLIYFFSNKKILKNIFAQKRNYILALFVAMILIVPACYNRWISVAAGLLFIIIMLFLLYAQQVMTQNLFEKVSDICCYMSSICFIYAVIQKIYFFVSLGKSVRSTGGLLNANYYGTIIEFVILLCVYRILTNNKNAFKYIIIIAINVVGLILCDCQSAWLAIIAGILVMLFLNGHTKIAVIFLAISAVLVVIAITVPGILPRWNKMPQTYETRSGIWQIAKLAIKDTPLFGRGTLAFWFNHEIYGGYQTYHAHSLYLEPLVSYGIVGVSTMILYILTLVKEAVKNKLGTQSRATKSLLFAMTIAIAIHGFTDYSILWVQTGMLLCFILSAGSIRVKKETI